MEVLGHRAHVADARSLPPVAPLVDRDRRQPLQDLVGVDRTSRAVAHDLMRRVPPIPETLRLDQALAEFRRQRAGLAVVIDEFGGTAGLVTLEDVIAANEAMRPFLPRAPAETPSGTSGEPSGSA